LELAGGGGCQSVAVAGQLGGQGEDVLADEPFLVAALTPVGEVLLGDGEGVEVLGEEGLDLGEGIEPREDLRAELAILEAGVELGAKVVGQSGDFSGAGHKNNFGG